MKITINDKEYYSDDFNEEQMALLNQITAHQQQMAPFEFALSCMQAVQQGFTTQLAASLEAEEEPEPEEKPKPKPKRKTTAKKS